ncbi:MAG: uridine kinase [Anaerolineales bacterium]|nr:uridine kinase [Anaerolineales bacterium]
MPPPPVVIGLAGGTGSGKTTVANVIFSRAGAERLAYVPHDAYYRNRDDLPPALRAANNWDHPDALETDLMVAHVRALKAGQPVELPVYNFAAYARTGRTIHVEPKPIILVEGILIFADPRLRALFDMKIFVDTDADLRFIRRLQRDIAERGRTAESVITQYLATVRPMHLEFVEPSKRYADIIVPEGGRNEVAMEMIVARVKSVAGA